MLFQTHKKLRKKKLLNKVIILVFFAHKKYSHSFITSLLNHWCHMNYFNNVITTFLGPWTCHMLLFCLCRVRKLGFYQKYLNLCSEDEQRSYGFGATWGRVVNDRIFIFGWTIPLSSLYKNRGHQTAVPPTEWQKDWVEALVFSMNVARKNPTKHI